MKKAVILGVALLGFALPLRGASYYPLRLDDPKAIYLTKEQFHAIGDGKADDSAAIQAAIDKAEGEHGEGIVFIPEGRYRITRTIYVWPGVRVIGYGANRPVFVLADNTPGYQQGIGYMVFFTGGRPGGTHWRERAGSGPRPVMEGTVPPSNNIIDANPGTFYSAMNNVDFEIGNGNPAAVGIRFHVAQHCFLTHIDFHIGSGLAALKDIGNEAEDLHFYGGDYGIITQKPSPGWQFTLLDSTFEDQRKAAIREHEAGLTLIHDTFRNVTEAISIDPDYAEELWAKDVRFENISGPAITISKVNNPRTEINLEKIACRKVPVFALLRETQKKVAAPGESYMVKSFSHGLTMSAPGVDGKIQTNFDADAVKELPPFGYNAVRSLPPANTWTNLKSLGAKGDGVTDDTAAVQRAIAEHRVIYIPMGRYVVSDTIRLRPDTVLFGLHPSMTQFDLLDCTPAFQGPGTPKALLETPQGGHNIVTGIGLYTNGINSRAVGALWMAGADSLMDDVRFLGGHGTNAADGTRINPYNNTHTADPDIRRRWDGQYPSLWITNGGGGTFADIWTPSTFAQAGLYISNTTTPGHVYELSSEHHVRNEVKLDRVENWELDAIQTEEERGESGFALPLEISRSKNITIANYHGYRVVSSYQPFPYAIKISESHDIRFRNVHVDSDSKAGFDNSVVDSTKHAEVRAYEFASLNVPEQYTPQKQSPLPPTLASGAQLERLATGFFNISGAAVDPDGQLYFVDAHWQRIYKWSPETREAVVVRDNPLDPVNLGFDKAGDLLVVSYAGKGTVYSFRPGTPMDQATFLKPEPATARPSMAPLLPVDVWSARSVPGDRPYQYVSPDGTVFIPAGEDFVQGQLYYGTKMADILRAFSLGKAVPGNPFYVSDESDEKTYKGNVTDKGTITGLQLFAERGGESVTQDRGGNVYLAAGQVLVYSAKGELLGQIDVPERPIDVVFGGRDRKTLYILTHTSLYSVKTGVPGL
ncbi:glycosyl hydrolase family 28-related protein [Alloacidobacterium sp.]|uniref:glycosyl hydrolase family 28-related protein n=1 Tax=Alloacidobacterium sp. TaxID=2951999 RepID=UPI002D4E0278|nr:glycosyl hydrolase family 28-related protein [Alloacidobacterium sp.]HYK36764.1 glycosyl hydrolase family 28-related protein [Alloacidobacterium sp.]